MTQITSHILDTSLGKPAAGVQIELSQRSAGNWVILGSQKTDTDGRIASFASMPEALAAGTYKLTFHLNEYYATLGQSSFYPYADIVFEITGDGQHYHVPLLLNPYGYTTYRGS